VEKISNLYGQEATTFLIVSNSMIIVPWGLKATLDKGSKNKVQWNQAFLLVKNFKLVPRPMDKDPRPRQINLWYSLHGIILEGKQTKPKKKKKQRLKESSWFGEPKCQPRSTVGHFSFFVFFHYFLLSLLLKFCENGWNVMDWRHCWEHTSFPIFNQF
jgi:hypothetical protein